MPPRARCRTRPCRSSEGRASTFTRTPSTVPKACFETSEFIEDGVVTDPDGLWGEIQGRVESPQGRQFVYESLTGSLYDGATVQQPPVLGASGDVVFTSEEAQLLNLYADDAVFRVNDAAGDDEKDFDRGTVVEMLEQSVTEEVLTRDEAIYVHEQIELRLGEQDAPEAPDAWEQGPTPFLSADQKAAYAPDIDALKQIYRGNPDGARDVSVAIERDLGGIPSQDKDFLSLEAIGMPHSRAADTLTYDRDAVVDRFGLDPDDETEQVHAEAIIFDGTDRLDDPGRDVTVKGDLEPALEALEKGGTLTSGQVDFIVSALFDPNTVPMSDMPTWSDGPGMRSDAQTPRSGGASGNRDTGWSNIFQS